MLGLNTFKKQEATVPAQPVESTEQPIYQEIALEPRRTLAFKHKISFHVDQSGIQLACSRQIGKQMTLLDARKQYFPAQNATDQVRLAFLTDSIDQYVREHGGKSAEIALSVSGPETAFRTFTMPELAPRALASAVAYEAKRQVPFPPSECHFDFRPVSRIQNNGKRAIKIALHAATNRAIDDRLIPFHQLGYDVAHIYHTHDVIGQLLQYLPDFTPQQHYTLINVERTRTEISYYHGSNLEFYHNCSIGSSFLARRSDPTVFEYFAESLAGEIQNSLDFYTGQYSGLFTTRIFIHGDLAYTDELLELLHNRFGYEFRRFPTESLSLNIRGDRARLEEMSVSLPVLASAVCSVELANLVPTDVRKRAKAKQAERLSLFGLVALVAIIASLWGSGTMRTHALESRLTGIQSEIAKFQQSTLFDTYNNLKHQLASGQAYLEKVKPTPSYMALVLKELSNNTPAGIRLTNLNYLAGDNPENMTMDGVSISSTLPPEVILAEFVEALRVSPFFEDVTVIRYTKRTENNLSMLTFSLTMRSVI